jgi:DNA-binding PadR family transcriptional regulator
LYLNGKVLFVTTVDKCYTITTEGHQQLLELKSTHAAQTEEPAVAISSDDDDDD